MSTEITFVTGNKKKAEEVARILAPKDGGSTKFLIVNKKLDLPELQGDPEEIALEKCRLASKEVDGELACCLSFLSHALYKMMNSDSLNFLHIFACLVLPHKQARSLPKTRAFASGRSIIYPAPTLSGSLRRLATRV